MARAQQPGPAPPDVETPEAELPDDGAVEVETEAGAGVPAITRYMRAREFWRAAKAYQPRAGVTYHLYRRWPVIDLGLTGEPKRSIDIQTDMDAAYVLEHWGSGEYRVYLKDQNRAGNSEVCYTIFRLDDARYPPVVNQDNLVVGHPRNVGYIEGLKAQGKWERDMKPDSGAAAVTAEVVGLAKEVIQQHTRQPAAPEVGLKETLALMTTGFQEILKQAINPFDQLAKAKEVLGGGPDPAYGQLLQTVMAQVNSLTQQLIAVQQAPAAPAAPALSPLEQVNQTLELIERLNERASVQASPWAGVLEQIARAFAPVVAAWAASQLSRGPAGTAPAPAPALPSAGGSGEVHQPAGPATSAAPASNAAPASGIVPEVLPPMMQGAQVFVAVAQDGIAAFQAGVDGASFAEAVTRKHGDSVYDAVVMLGRDTILQVIQTNAQGQPFASRMGDVVAFVDEFLAWGQDDEPGGGGQ